MDLLKYELDCVFLVFHLNLLNNKIRTMSYFFSGTLYKRICLEYFGIKDKIDKKVKITGKIIIMKGNFDGEKIYIYQ